MVQLDNYITNFEKYFEQGVLEPWKIIENIADVVESLFANLDSEFLIEQNVAIHRTAIIETNVILKGPIVIGKNCFIGTSSYLRGGVILGNFSKIGTGCEVKSSIILEETAIAHFNFIGDSIIGNHVNFEAGAITANHFNERENKNIFVRYNNETINTGVVKFGALVGDHSKIGANAVLSPGTLLPPKSIVKRLELIEQVY
jgi:UDP-N-acetylglucosamine diphosphorylase / glucose-1-phosphate thymidylyltransferase / UDP-N-acetylgalactosamine diphosphorylase / glucosamine-1-phosphate N-acetyltransferase / galactosamine-1-phosphate N-acetyltransferase